MRITEPISTHTRATIAISGMRPIVSAPSVEEDSGIPRPSCTFLKSGTGSPSVMSSAMPRTAVNVPSVAMKSGTWQRVMTKPLNAPTAKPAPRPSSSASGSGQPQWAKATPMTDPDSAAHAATDRSMPRETITIVCPTARIIGTEYWRRMFSRLLVVRKSLRGDREERDQHEQDQQRAAPASGQPGDPAGREARDRRAVRHRRLRRRP